MVFKTWIVRVAAAIGLIVLLYVAFWIIRVYQQSAADRNAISATEENRAIIVGAIDYYYSNKGVYPASLNELVPNYLPSIPKNLITRNTDWKYESDGDHYDFGYLEYPDSLNLSVICTYSSREPE